MYNILRQTEYFLWKCRTTTRTIIKSNNSASSPGVNTSHVISWHHQVWVFSRGHKNDDVRCVLLTMSRTESSIWVGSHVGPHSIIAVEKRKKRSNLWEEKVPCVKTLLAGLWRHQWPAASVWPGSPCVSGRWFSRHVERVWGLRVSVSKWRVRVWVGECAIHASDMLY